jgi:GH24 family phage-related lysozyme (muramidase)
LPGDIILFGGTYGGYEPETVTHVGIVVEGGADGMMVDRSTSSAPVKHRSINHFPHFKGAIRVASSTGGGKAEDIAIDFMKQPSIEGFHPTPYWDYAQWSWGYGTKAPCSGEDCASITPEQAHQEMSSYLSNHCSPLLNDFGLNDNQKAAALSLCYNLGPGQFQQSRAYQAMQSGDMNNAIALFDGCVHAGQVRLAGLVKRRNMEQELWGMPDASGNSAGGQSCLI